MKEFLSLACWRDFGYAPNQFSGSYRRVPWIFTGIYEEGETQVKDFLVSTAALCVTLSFTCIFCTYVCVYIYIYIIMEFTGIPPRFVGHITSSSHPPVLLLRPQVQTACFASEAQFPEDQTWSTFQQNLFLGNWYWIYDGWIFKKLDVMKNEYNIHNKHI